MAFLKKGKETNEMKLEGERVKEIKPGEDNIILYKKSSVCAKFPTKAFTSKCIINQPTVRETEFAT